jgi:hypothetical protein
MRAVVCRADQSLAEYDASVFAQQEFETQQEQLLAKGRVSTAGRAGLLRTYEVRRESLDDIHGALPQLTHLVADHAQNMAALVKLSERFALADPTFSPDARALAPAAGTEPAPAREYADFATAEELLGETEARRALLLAKLERTRTAVIGRRGRTQNRSPASLLPVARVLRPISQPSPRPHPPWHSSPSGADSSHCA